MWCIFGQFFKFFSFTPVSLPSFYETSAYLAFRVCLKVTQRHLTCTTFATCRFKKARLCRLSTMEEEVSVSPVSVSSRSSPTSLAILGAVSPNSSTRRSVQLDLDDIMLPSMQLVQVDASEDVWGELERLLYNNETTTPSSPVKCSAHPESGHIPVLRTVSAASSDNNAVGHRRQASVGDWNVASMSSVLELTSLKSNSGQHEFLLLPHQESAEAPRDAQNGTSSKVGGKHRGFIIMDLDPSPTKVVSFQQLMTDTS